MLGVLGQHKEAFQCYDKIFRINPFNVSGWRSKARLLSCTMGRYEEALSCCDIALEIDQTDEESLSSKAEVLNAAGKFEEAIDQCDKILELYPENAVGWSEKGKALSELDKKEDAIFCIRKALQINPNNGMALVEISYIYYMLSNYEGAIEYCEEFELHFSSDSDWNSHSLKSMSLYQLKRYEETIFYCNKSLEIAPEDKFAYMCKGNSLLALKKYQETIDCFSRLLEIYPRDEDSWFRKSFAHLMLGDKEEAIKCLDKALEINSKEISYLYLKAEILEKVGKLDESLNCYKTLAQIEPNFKDKNELSITDCISQLQELILKQKIAADIKKTNTDEIKTEVAEQKAVYSSATGNDFNKREVYAVDKELIEYLKRELLKDLISEMNSQLSKIIHQSIKPVIKNQQIIVENQNLHHRKVMINHNLILENQKVILENVRVFGNELANLKNEFKNCNSEDIISLIENKMDEFGTRTQKENKKDYEKYVEAASKDIVNWSKLNENTKEYLAMAEYLYSSLGELNDHEGRDYSPIILEICRSFENELKDKIFYNFIQYACNNFDDIDSFESDLNPNAGKLLDALSRQKREQKAHLTLREMCNILDCVRLETDAKKQTELIKAFRKYVKDRFNLNRIIDNNFLRDVDEICNYRNESAHVDRLSKNHADKVKTKGYILINNLVDSKTR